MSRDTNQPNPLFASLKNNLLSAVQKYIDDNIGGETGKLRAYNFKRAVLAVSDTDAQKQIENHNPLIELMITVIFYTNSKKLKNLIFKYNGVFQTEETFLTYLQQNQNRENSRLDYFYYEKSAELTLPRLSENYQPAISDWTLFRNNLKTTTEAYLKKGDGGTEGKFRAERLLEVLEKITNPAAQQRELALLACIITFKTSSKILKDAILTDTSLTESQLRELQYYQQISSLEITRRECEINSSILFRFDQGDILKAKIMDAINRYLARKNPDGNSTTTAIIKANQVKAALESCDQDTHELMRLVYLIILSTSFFDSAELKNDILAAIGLRADDFKFLVYAYNYEEFYGNFKNLTKKDAEHAFENNGFPVDYSNTIKTLDIDYLTINPLMQSLRTTIANYRRKHRDALGFARANNLSRELSEIESILGNAPYETTQGLLRKRIITLVCAIVFKSGSTELKKEILKEILKESNLDQKLSILKTEQFDLGISNYTVWKKALEINTITPVTNWENFRNALLLPAKAYRNADFGGADGKRRAQNIIDIIEKSLINMTDHQYHYHLIVIANAIVFKSGSKILRSAMLDYLSTINIDEIGLKNLAIQYGVSENTIEATKDKLVSLKNNVAHTANSNIEADWEKYVKPGLDLAITRYQATKQGGSRGKLRAENIRKLLEKMSDPLTPENKKHLALIMCTLVLLDKSTILKQKIMLCAGMNTDQIKALQKQENISDAAYVEFEKRLTDERKGFVIASECDEILRLTIQQPTCAFLFFENRLACPINNWNKFIGDLFKAIASSKQTILTSNFNASLKKIEVIPNPQEKHYQLALLVCSVVLFHSEETKTLSEKILKETELKKDDFKTLRKIANIEPRTLETKINELRSESTEMSAVSSA